MAGVIACIQDWWERYAAYTGGTAGPGWHGGVIKSLTQTFIDTQIRTDSMGFGRGEFLGAH
jgi:hypothetical protein